MKKQKRIVITDKFIINKEKPLSKFETMERKLRQRQQLNLRKKI